MSATIKGYPLAELRWTIPQPVAQLNPNVTVQVDHGARALGAWIGETGERYPQVRFEAWVDRSLTSMADAIEQGGLGLRPEGMLRIAHSSDEGQTWDRIEQALPVGEIQLLKLSEHMTTGAIEMQATRHGLGPCDEPSSAPVPRTRRLN